MDRDPGSTGDLRRRRDELRVDAGYLGYQVEGLRTRTELRTVYWRLGRTALWTIPLILLGLGAGKALDAWLGLASLFRGWFGVFS